MAERVGFKLTVPLTVHKLSKPAPKTLVYVPQLRNPKRTL